MTTNLNLETQAAVIEKIRKLLALSKSPNENEAMAAASKAQALLTQHNLLMSEVVKDKSLAGTIKLDASCMTKSRPWIRVIAVGISRLYFCTYFYTHVNVDSRTRASGYERKDRHTFVGEEHNIAVARSMFEYLCKTVERLANQGALTVNRDQRSGYKTSFRTSCANTISSRLWEMYREACSPNGVVSGSNLPVVNLYDQAEKQAQAFLKSKGIRLTVQKKRSRITNLFGASDGKEAGAKVSLHGQVAGASTSSKHLITDR